MAPSKSRKKNPKDTSPHRFKPFDLVDIYRYARMGMSDQDICRSMEIGHNVLTEWKKRKPDVVKALELGRQAQKESESWVTFIYGRMRPELRELWDQIRGLTKSRSAGVEIETLLADRGEKIRQELYLHALVFCNYNPSKAMACVNVDKKTVTHWKESNPNFAELIEEMQWHKGNFFEEALHKLVQSGDRAAVLFGNRTINRDRGYGNKVEVSHGGQVDIHHDVMDLAELFPYLEQAVVDKLMTAMRQREESLQKERFMAAQPAEIRLLGQMEKEIEELPTEEGEEQYAHGTNP